jgi:hypothetical protein
MIGWGTAAVAGLALWSAAITLVMLLFTRQLGQRSALPMP